MYRVNVQCWFSLDHENILWLHIPVDLMKLMVIYMPLQCSILSLSVSLAEGFGNEMEVASSLGKGSE